MNNQPEHNPDASSNKGLKKWLKRFGIAGFLFFLLKGIFWLTIGSALMRYLGCKP